MASATETDRFLPSLPRSDASSILIEIVRKQGILGLVLIAMMYFIWNGEKNKRADTMQLMTVIERNTEAFTKNAVLWQQVEFHLAKIKDE